MDKKYQISLNHNQLRVLEKALDLYTRVGIGQLEIVGEVIKELFGDKIHSVSENVRKLFDYVKKELFGFGTGASFGIPSPNVSNTAKVGYDMQKMIQKQIAEVEDHNSMSVWRDGDILHLGSEPSIEVMEIVKAFPEEAA